MYEQAQPVRFPVSGPGNSQTSGPTSKSEAEAVKSTVREARLQRAETGEESPTEGADDSSNRRYVNLPDTACTTEDSTYPGGTNGRRALRDFVRSYRGCIVGVTAVVATLIIVGLVVMVFIYKEETSQLSGTVDILKRNMDDISDTLDDLKRNMDGLSQLSDTVDDMKRNTRNRSAVLEACPREPMTGGVYIRWGRTSCPMSAKTVYSGVAGGTHGYGQPGGGTNYLCLPKNPQWGKYQDGFQGHSAWIYGAEYHITADVPFGDRSLHDHNVVCSVCHTCHNSVLMIPARKTCPPGWYLEYDGYLMAEFRDHAGSKEFVCMDKQPQAAQGGHTNQDGALFFPTEAHCGSLPCPAYAQGRELTCVVCVK